MSISTLYTFSNSIRNNIIVYVYRCKKNCEYLSNPLQVIYLSVETSCKRCTFEWYYRNQSDSDSKFISAKTISAPNTPSHIFIVMQNMLGYDTIYMFKAKGWKIKLYFGEKIFFTI